MLAAFDGKRSEDSRIDDRAALGDGRNQRDLLSIAKQDWRYRGDNKRHVALAQTARLAFESAVCEAARRLDTVET